MPLTKPPAVMLTFFHRYGPVAAGGVAVSAGAGVTAGGVGHVVATIVASGMPPVLGSGAGSGVPTTLPPPEPPAAPASVGLIGELPPHAPMAAKPKRPNGTANSGTSAAARCVRLSTRGTSKRKEPEHTTRSPVDSDFSSKNRATSRAISADDFRPIGAG